MSLLRLDLNEVGLATLTRKEVKRFWSVLGQTVTAPVAASIERAAPSSTAARRAISRVAPSP